MHMHADMVVHTRGDTFMHKHTHIHACRCRHAHALTSCTHMYMLIFVIVFVSKVPLPENIQHLRVLFLWVVLPKLLAFIYWLQKTCQLN